MHRNIIKSSAIPIGCLPQEDRNRWLLGEMCVGGFSNQLFGIFSMVPTALLLNSSLIFGEISSRHSFEHSWGEYATRSHIWLPFHYFFDWAHFQSYWKMKRNLVIVQKHTVATCLKELKSNFTVIPRKEFWGHDDDKILKLITSPKSLNISLPIPSNYTLFSMGSDWKMLAFYSFWQSDRHALLLQQMAESIRPNITLQYLIDGIRAQLGNKYIAVHLRIEADKFDNENHKHDGDGHYLENVYNMVESVAAFPEFKLYYNKTIKTIPLQLPGKNATLHSMTVLSPLNDVSVNPLPSIYIASGVFHSKFRRNHPFNVNSSHFMSKRAYHSLELFHSHGMLNVFTQFNLTGELFRLTQILSAEQLAYVEQEVCRHSTHFIHSSQRSSFSYMVLRMKKIDSKNGSRLVSSDEDLKSSYREGHSSWGFRV